MMEGCEGNNDESNREEHCYPNANNMIYNSGVLDATNDLFEDEGKFFYQKPYIQEHSNSMDLHQNLQGNSTSLIPNDQLPSCSSSGEMNQVAYDYESGQQPLLMDNREMYHDNRSIDEQPLQPQFPPQQQVVLPNNNQIYQQSPQVATNFLNGGHMQPNFPLNQDVIHEQAMYQQPQQFQQQMYPNGVFPRVVYIDPNANMMDPQFQRFQQLPQQIPTNVYHLNSNMDEVQSIALQQQDSMIDKKKKEVIEQIEFTSQILKEYGLESLQRFLIVEETPNRMFHGNTRYLTPFNIPTISNNIRSREMHQKPQTRVQTLMLKQHPSSSNDDEISQDPSSSMLRGKNTQNSIGGRKGRPRNIFEREDLCGVEKKCSCCGSIRNEFQYYNNAKIAGDTQPRYKCSDCGKKFTYNKSKN